MNLRQRRVYELLSIAAPLYYGLITLHALWSHDFMVQDDMRQHVVWFQQFIDTSVFKDDAIAHYFRSVAPFGVTAVYWLGAKLGIAPLLLAKLLPLPLSLVATGFVFFTTLAIAPNPLAAWLATLLFNQQLWVNDDLVSATPRAFVYPLFAAFLYYLVQRSLFPLLLTIALLGLFFPQMMLVAVAVLMVQCVQWRFQWRSFRVRLIRDRQPFLFAILGLVVALAVILPFVLRLSDYGGAVTVAQMRSLPEYHTGGRNQYFGVDLISFILHGSSGIRIPVFPSIVWVGFALPIVMGRWKMPTIQAITPQVRILLDVTLASLSLFVLAHVFLLRLHFPSRYTYHSWRFILAIATGIILAASIEKMQTGWQQQRQRKHAIALWLSGLAAVVIVGVPLYPPLVFAFQGWIVGDSPEIYHYLAHQPADTLVASLSAEANNIPAFAHRSTWTGREFALPHHPQYYAVISDRTSALLKAEYSPDQEDFQHFIDRSGVDFLLVESSTFTAASLEQDWLIQSRLQTQVKTIMAQLNQGNKGAIAPYIETCTVAKNVDYRLVSTVCLGKGAT